MDPHPLVVGPEVRQEITAWRAVRRGDGGVPVVDASCDLLGIVPPRHLVRILLEEHEEDLARLGAYRHETSMAGRAGEEPVRRRLSHRLPWLLIGLFGAVVSTGLMGASEEQLAANVALAFFLPGIVYMADAVGTQTETLAIRGLSVGVSIRSVLRREALTGVLVGLVLSLIFFPFSLLYGDARVALTAGLALLCACMVATLVAMGLPGLLHRLGRDPAFGSGPLATVVQDLLSISIYLLLARLLVR
jgi:magnesium transporter